MTENHALGDNQDSGTTNVHDGAKSSWQARLINLIRADGSLLLAARLVQLVNGFAITVILVRAFGLASAGTYAVASVAVVVCSLVCALGLNGSLPRSLRGVRAAPDDDASSLRSTGQANFVALVLILAALPVSLAGLFAYSAVMAHSVTEMWEILIFGASGYLLAQLNVGNTMLILQRRVWLCVMPPLLNTLGIAAGWLLADTPLDFALFITGSRLVGNALLFASFPYEHVSFRGLLSEMRAGLKFLPMDLFGTLSDQLPTFLLASFLSREELGIFGICRQLLMACETPGWSFVQSKYPELAQSGAVSLPMIRRKVMAMSIIMALAGVVLSFSFGNYIYHINGLGLLMLPILATLPARYLQNLLDQFMRAIGRLKMCTGLSVMKLALAVVCFPAAVTLFGLWGAIGTMAGMPVLLLASYAVGLGAASRPESSLRVSMISDPSIMVPSKASS